MSRLSGLLALLILGATLCLTPNALASTGDGFSQTKTLARYFGTADSAGEVGDPNTVTVRADVTGQLQGRERVHISWSGAHPSGARSASPFAENGINQEYPVVILQCRGRGASVTPETCWTNSRIQRSLAASPQDALWTRDLFAGDADRQVKSGLAPYPAAKCNDSDPASYAHVTTFVAASGKAYPSCTAEQMAPEASVGASFPAADLAAFTDLHGNGQANFEVRSNVENESLGCSDKVNCTIVVIPIFGLSCVDKAAVAGSAAADRNCRRGGAFLPGSSNFAGQGTDDAVTGKYWWSASNWRNRFQIPISFGLPPSACDVLDDRAPTPFFGSELISQAALQWAPAFCLRKDRFKWQANSMPDDAAFSLMQAGEAVAAEVSGPRESSGDPVVYAPTAVTGFALSYIIDRPDNAGEYDGLRLNARLIAKLLTQSYPASGLGSGHPGLAANPVSLNADPEFIKLNPGLSKVPQESAATLASLSTSSDVIKTLTSYVAADPDAVAFLAGKADPWGMTVNPSYKDVAVPTAQWPSLDTYVPPTTQECLKANPAPYLPQVAAPVQSLRVIASAVLDGWPLTATKCDRATPSDPFKLGRVDRQSVGSRFLIGLTTMADADRFGLATAALQSKPGSFVSPDNAGLAGSLSLARPAKPASSLAPFSIDQADIRKSGAAYPGTMIVYTAARRQGMKADDAAKVAQFITTSSTEGQRAGRGNGQLPVGYLPILDAGVTRPLFRQAQVAAAAIKAQKPTTPPVPKATTPPPSIGGTSGGVGAPGAAPASSAVKPAGGVAPTPAAAVPLVTARTVPVSSGLSGSLLPTVLALGLLAALISVASRLVLRARGLR